MRKNIFFLKLNLIANFFRLRDKKIGLLVKKFSSVSIQQKFALSEKYFGEKWVLFRKNFIFLSSFLEFEWFLCLFTKFLSQVCQTTDQRAERTKLRKLTFKNFVFFSKAVLCFEQKNLDFQHNSKSYFSKP